MLLVACALPLCGARAQRVGVALSGGAARGLAHIGVLKVLEEAGVPVDVITGTSMGSVVGGLYAVGYTAAQLDTIVRTEDWYRLLTDPVDRRDLAVDRKFTEDHYLLTLPIQRGGIKLPRSVVAGQRVSQLLTRLTWSAHAIRDFRALPIPFAAVATDLETSRAVVLDHGFLPDAIRASMALPSVFSPVDLGDTAVIDGGVVRNLPAQDARALGADVLICSDVTDPLEPRDSIVSLVDVLVQSVSFRVWDSEAEQRSKCDVLILPDVRAFSTFGFTRASEVIARGEVAAPRGAASAWGCATRAATRRPCSCRARWAGSRVGSAAAPTPAWASRFRSAPACRSRSAMGGASPWAPRPITSAARSICTRATTASRKHAWTWAPSPAPSRGAGAPRWTCRSGSRPSRRVGGQPSRRSPLRRSPVRPP